MHSIDAHELRDAMKALGVRMNMKQVKEQLIAVDQDKNGSVDIDEFTNLMRKHIKSKNTEEEF